MGLEGDASLAAVAEARATAMETRAKRLLKPSEYDSLLIGVVDGKYHGSQKTPIVAHAIDTTHNSRSSRCSAAADVLSVVSREITFLRPASFPPICGSIP